MGDKILKNLKEFWQLNEGFFGRESPKYLKMPYKNIVEIIEKSLNTRGGFRFASGDPKRVLLGILAIAGIRRVLHPYGVKRTPRNAPPNWKEIDEIMMHLQKLIGESLSVGRNERTYNNGGSSIQVSGTSNNMRGDQIIKNIRKASPLVKEVENFQYQLDGSNSIEIDTFGEELSGWLKGRKELEGQF
jgi:hypothetical protein